MAFVVKSSSKHTTLNLLFSHFASHFAYTLDFIYTVLIASIQLYLCYSAVYGFYQNFD